MPSGHLIDALFFNFDDADEHYVLIVDSHSILENSLHNRSIIPAC